MKSRIKLIEVLDELYRLNRSMGCNSSYGFYFSMESLKTIENIYFKKFWDKLSEEPYKIYKVGSHVQSVIDDFMSGQYVRLFDTKRQVLELGKLDLKVYDVRDEFISKRIPLELVKRYIKRLHLRNVNIKYGRGEQDKLRKYGVGSVTIKLNKDQFNKVQNLISSEYTVKRLKKKEAWYIRNDHTEFIIILKLI